MKSSDGIPKFLVSKDGLAIGSQVHLEEAYEGQYSVGYRLLKIFCDAVPTTNSPIISKL